MKVPKSILVAIDYGTTGDDALGTALSLAKALRAKVSVLHVCAMPYAVPPISSRLPASAVTVGHETNLFSLVREKAGDEMKARLARFSAEASGVEIETKVVSGEAREAIAREADAADLIVIGTRSRTLPARWFLGSVAQHTVRHSPCPVLVVPALAAEPERAVPS